ncbi:MAG TPA: BatC protein [Ornithinibacter sp.]|nr:BatC protein [Ornithinibacter sp.]
MSDTSMDDQRPDGDGTLGHDEGPADAGAGVPGEHDGGADGGAGSGTADGNGDLSIVSDTDAYASTEPLPLEEQTPPQGSPGSGVAAQGPSDGVAGDELAPGPRDGGADGGAEGPADGGAGDPATTGEHDGGADGGADASS